MRRPSIENSLASKAPQIVCQWHPTKNGSLTPKDVSCGSNKKVWWLCPLGHEWLAGVKHRKNGRGCPECSRKIRVETTLATKLIVSGSLREKNPLISMMWHPTKNGTLTPDNVTAGSNKKVWWKCSKGHEWETSICNRNRRRGSGCPCCGGKTPCKDTCLTTVNPDLAKAWHPTKNGTLTPNDITAGSNKPVWWLCEMKHETKTTVTSRNNGHTCSKCRPQTSRLELRVLSEMSAIFKGVKHREKIAGVEIDVYVPMLKFGIEIDGGYWHRKKQNEDSAKNKFFSNRGIFLLRLRECKLKKIEPIDIFFKEDEDFLEPIKNIFRVLIRRYKVEENLRTRIKLYLNGASFLNEDGYKELLHTLPAPLPETSLLVLNMNLAQEWHPNKNGTLTPERVTLYSNKEVWWLCKKGHEWKTSVASRSKGGCPFCSGRRSSKDNCLSIVNPTLAQEWHPARNGTLTPDDVTAGSNKKVWWKCSKGHEWLASINNRKKNCCPFCTGKAPCTDNCLTTINFNLSQEWHPTKNGALTSNDVTAGSGKKVYWLCKKGHTWLARIADRDQGDGCPICAGRKPRVVTE